VFSRKGEYGAILAKERGLNWEGLEREQWLTLSTFLDKATHPDPAQRFVSVADALAALRAPMEAHTEPTTQTDNAVNPSDSDAQFSAKSAFTERRTCRSHAGCAQRL